MSDSIRQQIIDELKVILKTILIEKGFKTDIGSKVFEWRVTDLQKSTSIVSDSEIPSLILRDLGETVVVRGSNHEYTLDIEIEAKLASSTAPKEIREVIVDIIKAIGDSSTTLDSLIANKRPVENESIGFEQKDRKFGSIVLKFELVYLTKAFKPLVLA